MKKVFLAVLLLVAFAGCDKSSTFKTDCDIATGPCVKTVGGQRVSFDVSPRPAKPMTELSFAVEIGDPANPVSDATVTLDLNMPEMNMGENKPVLTYNPTTKKYEGKGTMPACMSGSMTWRATVGIDRAGAKSEAAFTFNLAK